MTLRNRRQEEYAREFLNFQDSGILYLCPRFGKIRTSLLIIKELKPKNLLVAYPDKNIQDSWLDEFQIVGSPDCTITWTTHRSIEKHKKEYFDLIIIDEIHLLSDNQIIHTRGLNGRILGLTGTMSSFTERWLKTQLNLDVVSRYSISQAIEENVITDYQINIVYCHLDTKIKKKTSKGYRSEKMMFDALSYVTNKLTEEKKDSMFLRLKRAALIQRSIGKKNVTKKLIEKFKDERILVFCGLTEISDDLGIPSYHNKVKEKTILSDFAVGKGDKMAVVKLGNTGVTYKPLNKVIINYTDSNSENITQKILRCMAIEYNNPNKKADIWIVCSEEKVEKDWLEKALEFFDEKKIKYFLESDI